MNTKTIAAVLVGAMAFHLGLCRLLAAATTFGETQEVRDLNPQHHELMPV